MSVREYTLKTRGPRCEDGAVAEPLTREEWRQLRELLVRYIDSEFDNWATMRIEDTCWGTVFLILTLMAEGDPDTYLPLDP